MLRKLAQAQRDEPKRMVEAAKKQAKRLLKLAKATPDTLKITALHEAQEIVAKLHGYPNWKAMAGKR